MIDETTPNAMAVAQPRAVTRPDEGQPASLMNFVAAALHDPNVNVEKLSALLSMQRDVEADDARRQFNAALHAAQIAMPRVRKNGTIKLVKDGVSKGSIPFATWEDVDTILRPIMREHGFSLSFSSGPRVGADTGIEMKATLLHAAGHSRDYALPLPPDVGHGRNALQAIGSTLSYGKRYLAELIFNIVRENEDDDGDRGGATFISGEQKEAIVALMQEKGADTKAFLDFFEIAVLDDLREERFAQAMNMLRAKKGKPA